MEKISYYKSKGYKSIVMHPSIKKSLDNFKFRLQAEKLDALTYSELFTILMLTYDQYYDTCFTDEAIELR